MSLRVGSDERLGIWKEVVGGKKRERDFYLRRIGKVWQRSYSAFRSIPTYSAAVPTRTAVRTFWVHIAFGVQI